MIGKSFGIIGLTLLMAFALAGCQSTGMSTADTTSMDSAVVAVSNQGAVTILPGHGGPVTVLASSSAHVCEQCKMDAATYFSTGKLTEKCSVCGATRYAVMRGK